MANYKTDWSSTGWRLLYRQAIATLCSNHYPPLTMVDRYLDTDCIDLQQFAIEYATSQWMTGISILDAAHTLVEEAYGNANIDEHGNIL